MMNRRQVLGLATEEPQCGLPAGYFPDVVVEAHDGRRGRFWTDMVRGKTVVLHVFSLRGEAAYPVAANLAKVQALVGERMGRDVFLYSLTTDPEHDTPRALRDFAAAHGAGPGWLFLTGEPAAMELLRSRLFLHDAGIAAGGAHAEHAAAPVEDCSRGLLRYGNAAVGLWGSVPARTDPAWIAERIAWLTPRAPAAGPPRRRGPLPLAALAGLLLGLGAAAGFAQHPHPQPPLAPSCQTTEGNVTTIATGESHFPQSYPFVDPPGTNFLPTVYTNLFDSLGNEVQNTLPSTPTVFYNLHDGEPVVTAINPISPTQDLDALWDRLRDVGPRDPVESELIRAAIQNGIDILEGRPVRNRAYSGLPLLHYNGPEKIKKVQPIYDATGKVVGGNVDVHQVWYDNHFESDTGLLDVSGLGNALDVTWTVTYTIDVLARGEDDFSPYVMYWNLVPPDAPPPPTPPAPCIPPAPPPPGKRPGMGMDQSFFPMQEGTRTVLKIKMAPGPYYKLIYTWGWRMHPPRVQVMDDATMPVAGKTLAQWEIDTFGPAPTSSEEARLKAIDQIGDLSPAKKMWQALRAARDAAGGGDWKRVRALGVEGWNAFEDWRERNQLPKGVELDKDADLTLFYVNNTIYGEFTQGTLINFPPFQTRGTQVKVTLINGDYYERGYINVDFGGGRGWENQYKSSVKVAGSGCWFTFGRNYWWINTAAPVMLPPATRDPYKPSVQKVHITYNFDPGRRLRFYQFDPLHHDVAVFSVH